MLQGGRGDDTLVSRDALVNHLFGGRGDDSSVVDDDDDLLAAIESAQ